MLAILSRPSRSGPANAQARGGPSSAADDSRSERLASRQARNRAPVLFFGHIVITSSLLLAAFNFYIPTLLPIANPGDIRAAVPVILRGVSKTAGCCLAAWAYAGLLPSSILSSPQRTALLAWNVIFLVLLYLYDSTFND